MKWLTIILVASLMICFCGCEEDDGSLSEEEIQKIAEESNSINVNLTDSDENNIIVVDGEGNAVEVQEDLE